MSVIRIQRFNYGPAVPEPVAGTFGVMTMPGGETHWTVERAWLSNERGRSCIPEGVYTLQKRESPVVYRTTGGAFRDGWEVTSVPGRSLIMIHPANWPSDLEGCIGVGADYGILQNRLAVIQSRLAFERFMMQMDQLDGPHELHVLPYLVTYP